MYKRFTIYFALLSVVIDLSAILAGMVIAYNLRADGTQIYFWPFEQYLRFIVLFLPVWLITLASQGLYNPRALPQGWKAFNRLLIGLLSGWGVMIISLYLYRTPQAQVFPRLVIAYGLFWTLLLTLIGRIALNWLIARLYRARIGVSRAVVISELGKSEFLSGLGNLRLGRLVVAVITADYLSKLSSVSQTTKIDELIIDHPRLKEEILLELLHWAESRGANFTLVPGLLSVRATNVEIGSLSGKPVMYFLRTPLEGWQRVYKRVLDLLIIVPALIILSPILSLLFILIPLMSRGPALYRQPRVGQDGRIFYVHKFRSMYRKEDVPHQTDWSTDEDHDPRITPIGRFLRPTNLDELPQLWDILIGSMSLVGPRPEQPQYVEKFAAEIPDYLRRHHVKSGLTGWAQVNGLRGDTSIPERVKYDLYYIENWSIWFDLRIIVSTLVYLFRQLLGRNA